MDFDPTRYGPEVARILAMEGNGQNCAPLVCGPCRSEEARRTLAAQQAASLFPGVREPEAPMAGLWLYFSCFEEAGTNSRIRRQIQRKPLTACVMSNCVINASIKSDRPNFAHQF